MVESELLFATISEKGQIYVYKHHSSKRKGINMEILDHKILYLSYVGSWIETTEFKEMGNKIYFRKFQDNDILFYSLDTKKYHSCGDKFWGDDMYSLSESVYSTRIKPMF